jgi:hypothetical protein
MTEWAFLLTPLLVLPIVLLFRFVGCGTQLQIEPDDTLTTPPNYRDYILGEPNNPGLVKNDKVVPNRADIIAYWRLVDASTNTVASDEKYFQDGTYTQSTAPLAVQAPTASMAGSESASGGFFSNHISLIDSDSSVMCRVFDGGYVLVPYKVGLYTDEFTIEAWVDVSWNLTGYEHTLFSAGGFYRVPLSPTTSPTLQGFRIFADGDNRWQMNIFSRPGVVFTSPPLVPRNGKTHLAITVEKDPSNVSNRKVTLYSDGKSVAIETVGYYALAEGAPFLIGVGDAAHPLDSNSPQPYQPVRCPIQEVVLYRKALSADEIANHVDINRK